MTWSNNCVLISKATKEADYDADPVLRKVDNPENAILQIMYTKLYVPVVNVLEENNTKILEQFTLFRMEEEGKKTPYQFLPCNFY